MSSTLWALTVCDIHFCIWNLSKFIFMGSPFLFILVRKIPEFWWWKLWEQNFVPLNSENIHIKESKKLGFPFSVEYQICLSYGLMSSGIWRLQWSDYCSDEKKKNAIMQRLFLAGWCFLKSQKFDIYLFSSEIPLTLFKMVLFGAAHGWGCSLKSVTHILQWCNLAQLYFT